MEKIFEVIKNPWAAFSFFSNRGMTDWLSDKLFLKLQYRAKFGAKLNLENPVTFNEKLQWLKLYDRKPEYTTMVDKFAVKEYVAEKIGKEYIIPTLGVWNSFDEINFDELPNQFVLKCTHDSGGLVICKDKSNLNIDKARRKIEKSLNSNYYLHGREWSYKDVQPRIIAEQYMEDESGNGLLDYKFYCFNGEPKFLYVGFANIIDGVKHDQLTFFDLNWEKTPFYRTDHEEIPFELKKPQNFGKMIEIAKKLSKDIPFVRVDLYNINNNIYFSELTFYPGSGFGEFHPDEWEKEIGSWIRMPEKNDTYITTDV